jgi:hypothetical protein
MHALIGTLGRPWRQRTTLYADADASSAERALHAAPLTEAYNAPLARRRPAQTA